MERLLHLYGSSVFGFCCHLTGSRDAGEEIYQDTMLKMIEILDRLPDASEEDELIHARNYCMGIAIRLFRNQMRKEAIRSHLSLNDEDNGIGYVISDAATPEEQYLKQQEYKMIRGNIRLLPGKQQEVIYLFYYAGQTVSEIAEILHVPAGTVKSRLNAAKKKLKRLLEEDEV